MFSTPCLRTSSRSKLYSLRKSPLGACHVETVKVATHLLCSPFLLPSLWRPVRALLDCSVIPGNWMVLQQLLFLTKEATLGLQESVICPLFLTCKSPLLTTRFLQRAQRKPGYSQHNQRLRWMWSGPRTAEKQASHREEILSTSPGTGRVKEGLVTYIWRKKEMASHS